MESKCITCETNSKVAMSVILLLHWDVRLLFNEYHVYIQHGATPHLPSLSRILKMGTHCRHCDKQHLQKSRRIIHVNVML